MTRALLVALMLAIAIPSWGGEFDYASYRASSLPEAAAHLEIDPSADYWLDASTPKYHSVAIFTGRIRPIAQDTKTLMSHWATALPQSSSHMGLFTAEAEMTQGSSIYWMPIQGVLVGPIQTEVPAGTKVHLYLLLLGANKAGPVFVINEFMAGG